MSFSYSIVFWLSLYSHKTNFNTLLVLSNISTNLTLNSKLPMECYGFKHYSDINSNFEQNVRQIEMQTRSSIFRTNYYDFLTMFTFVHAWFFSSCSARRGEELQLWQGWREQLQDQPEQEPSSTQTKQKSHDFSVVYTIYTSSKIENNFFLKFV